MAYRGSGSSEWPTRILISSFRATANRAPRSDSTPVGPSAITPAALQVSVFSHSGMPSSRPRSRIALRRASSATPGAWHSDAPTCCCPGARTCRRANVRSGRSASDSATVPHEIGNDQRRREEHQTEQEEKDEAVAFTRSDPGRPKCDCHPYDHPDDRPERAMKHSWSPSRRPRPSRALITRRGVGRRAVRGSVTHAVCGDAPQHGRQDIVGAPFPGPQPASSAR